MEMLNKMLKLYDAKFSKFEYPAKDNTLVLNQSLRNFKEINNIQNTKEEIFKMPKKRKILTKEEIKKIAEYQWASIKNIMDIGAIGRNKAREVLNVISDQFYDGKSKVQNGLVSMDMVLEYFYIPNYKHGETINGQKNVQS